MSFEEITSGNRSEKVYRPDQLLKIAGYRMRRSRKRLVRLSTQTSTSSLWCRPLWLSFLSRSARCL